MKRVISLILSMVMLFGINHGAYPSAFANDFISEGGSVAFGIDIASLNEISEGEVKTAYIRNEGTLAYFKFIPKEDGVYTFYSTSKNDTCGYLYDADMNELTSDDDGGSDCNFSITYNFVAGEVYVFGAGYCYSSDTGRFKVKLEGSNIKSISFEFATGNNEIEEFTHGKYAQRWDDELQRSVDYYRYDLWSIIRCPGNSITINYKNGDSEKYTCAYKDSHFDNEYGEHLDISDVYANESQMDCPWQAGGEYKFTIAFAGASTQARVKIKGNSVCSVSYAPIKPIEYFENTNGESKGGYWHYRLPDYSMGDALSVAYKNGNTVNYTYVGSVNDDGCYYFRAENGDLISTDELNRCSEQASAHWSVGSSNYFTVEYNNATCKVPVSIIGVSSIEYVRNNQKPIAEGVNYYFEEEYYYAPYISPELGDKLVVNYSNGNSKQFLYSKITYSSGEWECAFTSSDGAFIDDEDISYGSYRDENGRLMFKISYAGKEASVEVNEKKAVSVEYASASAPIIDITDADKRNMYRYENDNGEGYLYYSTQVYYAYENDELVPLSNIIQKGDTIKVTYDNGEVVTYTYNEKDYEWGYVFEGDNGSELRICGAEGTQINDNQHTDHWVENGNNYFTVSINGVSSNRVSVIIAQSPIDDIEFISSEEYVAYESINGEYSPVIPRGTLVVNYKDGGKREYAVELGGAVPELGISVGCCNEDSQSWSLGDNNRLTIYALGKTTMIPVRIIESEVESISVSCDKIYSSASGGVTVGVPYNVTINYKNGASEQVTLCSGESYKGSDFYVEYEGCSQDKTKDEASIYRFKCQYEGASCWLSVPCEEAMVSSIELNQIKIPKLNGELVAPLSVISEGCLEFTVTFSNGETEHFTSDELLSCYKAKELWEDNGDINDFFWEYAYVGKYVLSIEYYTTFTGDYYFADGTNATFCIDETESTISILTKEKPHSHSYSPIVTEPTCKALGFTTYVCSCGDSYVSDYTEDYGEHSFGNWKNLVAPTCTEKGFDKRSCLVCGYTEMRETAFAKHSYIKAVTAPTCTEWGYTTNTCTACGYVLLDSYVKPTGHMNVESLEPCEATCTQSGLTEGKICADCGEIIAPQQELEPLGHSYRDVVVKKATASSNGSVEARCEACGEVASAETIYKASSIKLSATAYTYNGKVKKPSVAIKDSKGNIISSDNYKVTYEKGRKSVGRYFVKITFKGNYSGSKTLYFNIKPRGTEISKLTAGSKSFTVKWKKQATQTTGYELQYATNSGFSKNKKSVIISNSSSTSKKATKLKGNAKYYVRIRTYKAVKVDGKLTKIYSDWSVVKTIKTKK